MIPTRDGLKKVLDCPVCPLYPCPYIGTMPIEECIDDVLKRAEKIQKDHDKKYEMIL